ncbi:hypothetical protein PF006_g32577, partial [Phytophthora fragariae]
RAEREGSPGGKRRTGVGEGPLRPVESTVPQNAPTDSLGYLARRVGEATTGDEGEDSVERERRAELATRASDKQPAIEQAEDLWAAHGGNCSGDDGNSAGALEESVEARVSQEVTTRDAAKAKRYVETVRPAMAALKYVREAQEEVGSREVLRLVEEGDEQVEWKAAVPTEEGERHASAEEVRLFEEGGVAVKDAGGSVVAVVANTGAMADEGSALKGTSGTAVVELGGHLVPRVTDVAKVRMTRKAARREAKDRRIDSAKVRVALANEGAEHVERVVQDLDAELERRRRAQAEEAHEELE